MTQTPQVERKWRPPLALVIYSVLLTVMALPVLLLAWFRPAALDVKPLSITELGALCVVLAFTVVIGYVLVRAIKAPLDALVARALTGGTQGVMQVAITAPQNQSRRIHDQNNNDHQQ
mgnify:CR=1 FL=1